MYLCNPRFHNFHVSFFAIHNAYYTVILGSLAWPLSGHHHFMHLSHQNVLWISVAHLMLYNLLKYSSSARVPARLLVCQYIEQQSIYSTHMKLVSLSDTL